MRRTEQRYGDAPAGKATLTRKAKELWRVSQIKPGDLIVANRGMSHVLGVGEVQDPPDQWAGENIRYPHRIRVKWDTARCTAPPIRNSAATSP